MRSRTKPGTVARGDEAQAWMHLKFRTVRNLTKVVARGDEAQAWMHGILELRASARGVMIVCKNALGNWGVLVCLVDKDEFTQDVSLASF
jgi:hypothetical protein